MPWTQTVSTVLVILAAFPACQSTLVGNFATSPSSAQTLGFVNSLLPLRRGPQPPACIQSAREHSFVVGQRSLHLRQPAAVFPKLNNQRAKHRTGTSMLLYDSFSGDGWDDYDGMDLESSYRVVLLRDTNSDRVIECFVDREMEVDGKKYATLLPVDTPVILAGYTEVNGTNQLVPVLEDGSIDKLFPTASAVLAEMDLSLSRSAVVLTVEGRDHSEDHSDDDSDEEGDIIFLGGGDPDEDSSSEEEERGGVEELVRSLVHGKRARAQEPRTMVVGLKGEELVDRSKGEYEGGRGGSDPLDASEEDDEDDEDSNEKVQVLATFYQDGNKYVVAAPLEPVLIIGAPASKPADVTADVGRINELNSMLGGPLEVPEPLFDVEYLLPEREELERVTPRIEAELETLWDEEEKERKGLSSLRQRLISQWRAALGEGGSLEDDHDDDDHA
mmetsp:Transcript_51647/g.121236  ORF Transcript_51647/g.121236 Transcript_51647/m.121236 type:complete len:445 (-) Transcript_51647:89-1423(-)